MSHINKSCILELETYLLEKSGSPFYPFLGDWFMVGTTISSIYFSFVFFLSFSMTNTICPVWKHWFAVLIFSKYSVLNIWLRKHFLGKLIRFCKIRLLIRQVITNIFSVFTKFYYNIVIIIIIIISSSSSSSSSSIIINFMIMMLLLLLLIYVTRSSGRA